VVLIITYDSENVPLALGSGFFFSPNEIATNFHVIDGASRIVCRVIGEKNSRAVTKVISVSKSLDLAILHVDEQGPTLQIRDGAAPAVGEKVVAIGNPRGLEGSLSEGIISGVRLERDFSLIQITAPISPGSSGGPVLDEDGHVVGVATMTLTESQNLNFAVPATLISTLRTKGEKWEPVVVGSGVKIDHGSAGIRLIEPVFEDIYGGFDYSLKNENDRPIENLHYILLFRSSSGEVLHFQIVELKKPIPP
jgi:S1-C subfamily serine protease